MWEFAVILLLVGALVLLARPLLMRRRGAPPDWPSGQLLVTGVSPRPSDVTGPQYATITGVINGPTVNEHVVYQRLEVDVDDWPTMGQLFPVVYSPKNPDNWRFASPEAPPPAPPPTPYS
ncbi:hypothetical protein [Mycobacterium sp. IS-3022]|uniref:hypothetical protein n=1 Tax=Mycobacterium sp. IS-3022 TaxID=1772277 RepID=UPI00074164CA|nr:hypothetical protein [Mycobacterium sp. IS-3022]KUH93918.1 hypothetical protein AU188_07820 [Mycobacterium sp. IS-3022]